MKCKRCGQEVVSNLGICEKCGFDMEAFNKLTKVTIKEDPIIDSKKKTNLVDSPILTFIFGLLSVLMALIFVAYLPNVIILYLLLLVIFNILTFKMAKKPTKVKLIPVVNVGKAMAYFSIGFVLFKVVYDVLGLLFFS